MNLLNILTLGLVKGKGTSKMKKVISAGIVIGLFVLVIWYYNKDNDQTKNISDAVKKQYEDIQNND